MRAAWKAARKWAFRVATAWEEVRLRLAREEEVAKMESMKCQMVNWQTQEFTRPLRVTKLIAILVASRPFGLLAFLAEGQGWLWPFLVNFGETRLPLQYNALALHK
jgi:hypothetical protein